MADIQDVRRQRLSERKQRSDEFDQAERNFITEIEQKANRHSTESLEGLLLNDNNAQWFSWLGNYHQLDRARMQTLVRAELASRRFEENKRNAAEAKATTEAAAAAEQMERGKDEDRSLGIGQVIGTIEETTEGAAPEEDPVAVETRRQLNTLSDALKQLSTEQLNEIRENKSHPFRQAVRFGFPLAADRLNAWILGVLLLRHGPPADAQLEIPEPEEEPGAPPLPIAANAAPVQPEGFAFGAALNLPDDQRLNDYLRASAVVWLRRLAADGSWEANDVSDGYETILSEEVRLAARNELTRRGVPVVEPVIDAGAGAGAGGQPIEEEPNAAVQIFNRWVSEGNGFMAQHNRRRIQAILRNQTAEELRLLSMHRSMQDRFIDERSLVNVSRDDVRQGVTLEQNRRQWEADNAPAPAPEPADVGAGAGELPAPAPAQPAVEEPNEFDAFVSAGPSFVAQSSRRRLRNILGRTSDQDLLTLRRSSQSRDNLIEEYTLPQLNDADFVRAIELETARRNREADNGETDDEID